MIKELYTTCDVHYIEFYYYIRRIQPSIPPNLVQLG